MSLLIIKFYLLVCTQLLLIKSNGMIPIIGIIANTYPETLSMSNSSVIYSEYVRWLEDAGAKVVPISSWYNDSQIDQLFSQINGVLWQGGMINLTIGSEFVKFNEKVLQKIINLNKKGEYFPLWLTCQGFELIHIILTKDDNCLNNFNSWDDITPLQFDEEAIRNTKMFTFFDKNDFLNLRSKNTTVHYHNYGVNTSLYEKHKILSDMFKITTFGRDRDGKKYIASIEGLEYPIFGTQFHPEELPYSDSLNKEGVSPSESIKISQLFGLSFVEEARKSKNKMNEEELKKWKFINTFIDLPEEINNELVYKFIND